MESPGRLQSLWKGKAKAEPQDFDDLNPIITYRQLFAQNPGVRDPLRVIALCDSDAFYAACEMIRLGTDKDTPLVVLQWDSLIAINYPARKYGISRMDKLDVKEVKTRCPELIVVHVATYKEGEKEPGYWDDIDTKTHKVSLDYYRRESAKIATLFKECLPDCEIEKASIDEAFFDFTKPVREIMFERYPHIAQVPADAPQGLDTPLPPPPPLSWNITKFGYLVPFSPPSDGTSVDGTSHDSAEGDHVMATWHDIALSIAAELMGKAREIVHSKLGYSTSAGIARNKFLAKLAASYKKPNSQSILRNAAIPSYLKPMEFRKIRFLGGKLGAALAKEFDATTVGDLLSVNLDEIQRKFGDDSIWVHEVLRGIDRSEVKEKTSLNKSMLASKNLPNPITNASEGFHWIRVLAAELALRLNDVRKSKPNLWPKTLVLHARKGYEPGRSKQAPFPFTREVNVDIIASAGDKLWKELVGKSVVMKVTSIQLAFTGIETPEVGQGSIEGFLKAGQAIKRQRDYDRSLRVTDSSLNDYRGDQNDTAAHGEDRATTSFTCTRCRKTISLPQALVNVKELHTEALASLRSEHNDFHYAQDLANEPDEAIIPSGSTGHSPKKKKRRKEPRGIEKFFGRT
ncbi:hypothetical protein BDZ94DRAFT_1306143 [Collybia nuda]|uniref:DNA polymerase eta n=1 Tax=Collybia nuda TaxID=64659 RepID=A0A9P5YAF0_9AGAR|nr:hypothetical protein BDZ94DRAFT_1306143 [Collybia nuda]